MQKNNYQIPSILVIDSGLGGLSTLAKVSKQTPANYIYFADNKFVPYGTKSDKFLKKRLLAIISKFSEKHKLSAVILACNTATTTAISFLRESLPHLLFVGTEPAFKIAMDKNYISPALIATPQTISHMNKTRLKNFKFLPHESLASQIESTLTQNTPRHHFKLLKSLYSIKNQLKDNDCLVLGCTHYVLIKENFSKLLNRPILDGNTGVSNQISKYITNKTSKNSSFKIILSKQNKVLMQKYKKILKQILANQIKLC